MLKDLFLNFYDASSEQVYKEVGRRFNHASGKVQILTVDSAGIPGGSIPSMKIIQRLITAKVAEVWDPAGIREAYKVLNNQVWLLKLICRKNNPKPCEIWTNKHFRRF